MQKALIEDAENDVDHQDGHREKHAEARKRGLERLRVALECRRGGRRKSLPREIVDFGDRVPNRCAGFQVKGYRYRRELTQVVDRKRPERGTEFGYRADGHELAGGVREILRSGRRVNIERGDLVCVALIFRFQFQDDPILIVRRKNRGNLTLPVGGVNGVFNLIHRDPVRRRRIAVDFDIDLGISDLKIAADVREARELAHFGGEILSRTVQLVRMRALYRELVEGLALKPADTDRGIIA